MKKEPCLPVVKWPGGKRKLLPELLKHVPKKIDVYAEPFAGGAALFFHIWPRCKEVVLIDQNKDLVIFYRQLRDNPKELIAQARAFVHDEKTFYWVRSMNPKKLSDVHRAARMLYLNKTCFNGLWRVNAKGKFNVPFGRYTNPRIVDEEALMKASRALQIAHIIKADFHVAERYKPTFLYLDPPYDPVSTSSNFTRYAKGDFMWKDQERLEEWASGLRHMGSVVMLSNANTKRVRKLYRTWDRYVIKAARSINANGKGRAKVEELVIT
jgi:DNA adenine methylase